MTGIQADEPASAMPSPQFSYPAPHGNVAAFLMSDLASGVTGEITYVDAGYNIVAPMSEE